MPSLAVDIVADVGERRAVADGVDGSWCEAQVPLVRRGERGANVLFEVVLESYLALGFVPYFRTAYDVVRHQQTGIIVHQADKAAERALGIVDRVIDDPAVLGVIGQDAIFVRAGHKVVPDGAARAVVRRVLALERVAEPDARIAVDDD